MKAIQLFKAEAKANYAALKKTSLEQVVRWTYGTGSLFSIEPMFFERAKIKRGREITSAKKARWSYGFDANGRLVYEKEDLDLCGLNERLYVRRNDHVFCVHYYSNHPSRRFPTMLRGVSLTILGSNERPKTLVSEGGRQDFTWRGDKLMSVDIRGEGISGWREELVYDACGEFDQLWIVCGKQRQLSYKRPPQGINIKTLKETVHKNLVRAITRALSNLRIAEPAYCLAIAYDGEGNDALPPCIGIGLDSERQKWMKEHGKDAKDLIWNPAEFTHYEKPHTQLKDKELDKSCELLNELLRANEDCSTAVKLLVNVAAELGKLDWKGKLKTTPDFVVYAVDFELADLKKNLKQSVPAAKLAKLKKAKLL